MLSLVALQLPGLNLAEGNESNQDDFPERRQGGGTHWVIPGMKTVSTDEVQRPC